jgi:levanase
VLEIQAEFQLGTAEEFGLIVRGGDDEQTRIGYDVDDEEIFVDRTRSGIVDFSADFPGVHAGPLQVRGDRVTFTVYVDRSSVEVFAGRGETTITDLIFPDASSEETSLYADGGTVTVRSLTVRPLRSIWSRGAGSHS